MPSFMLQRGRIYGHTLNVYRGSDRQFGNCADKDTPHRFQFHFNVLSGRRFQKISNANSYFIKSKLNLG